MSTLPNPAKSESPDQRELARRILAGDPAATRYLLETIKPDVEAFLFHQCWNGQNRSLSLAREVIDDLFSECFGGFARNTGRKPLLASYRGGAKLATWLKTAARHRLITRMTAKRERDRVEPTKTDTLDDLLEGQSDDHAVDPTMIYARESGRPAAAEDDPESERNVVKMALREAIEALEESDPDVLVLIELHFLHGVQQNVLARSWKVQPSTITRQIQRALERLRVDTMNAIRRSQWRLGISFELTYTVEDFLEADCLAMISSRGASASSYSKNNSAR